MNTTAKKIEKMIPDFTINQLCLFYEKSVKEVHPDLKKLQNLIISELKKRDLKSYNIWTKIENINYCDLPSRFFVK